MSTEPGDAHVSSRAPVAAAPPESLVEMQRLLRALVTAPTGVQPALEGRPGVPGWLDAWSDPAAALAGTVRSDDRLAAPARLDVYAQAYFARLLEVLEGDYPTVAWLCGEAAFHDLVTAYLVAHPSSSPSLRDLGHAFADFLTEHPVAAFARERFPGVDDIARLEWAFADVFDAPDATPLQRADLARVAPEAWSEIALEVVPAFARLTFSWSVGEMVTAQRRGDAAAPNRRSEPQTLIVWRERERAVFRSVDALEAEALARIVAGGETFGDLGLWLDERLGDAAVEEPAALAAGWLARWIDAGWLAR